VVAALSLATDLAMGQPLESGLGICMLGVRIADRAGLGDEERGRVHDVALLRHAGCTAENQSFSAIVGDELAFREGAMTIEATNPRVMFPAMLRYLVRTNGLMGAAGKLAQMAGQRDRFQEAVLAVCEVAEMLAERIGLPEGVQHDLLLGNERWDGKSFLKRAKGEDVPVPVRVVQIAECASVYRALHGPEAAAAVVRARAGGAFDPALAELFCKHATELCAEPEGQSVWDAVIESAPSDPQPLGDAEVDAALAAMAEFVDLKSPFTAGHSSGVARLAGDAGVRAGLPPADVQTLRRAGLVHEIGQVGVPSQILEKAGTLNADEWERVRLHTYLGERILARSPGLSRLAGIGTLHHERCDGSGYHRGLDARSLSHPARLLAAADAFRAMTEPRPHRPAMTPEAAAGELRRDAREGRLDGDAVACVLDAAGSRQGRRRERVAGLTAREAEVLRLVARGLATKQIAAELVISPKTADTHIQHIYTKIGVSTRAAATVFAMRHDLVDADQRSGELPM
jgi:HD-GYP domain-containing protein (c-di-GMP phosphodiesterase class II)